MPHDYCFKWLPANPFPNILSWLSASSTPKDHSLPSLHKWIANHQLPSEHIQSTAESPQRNHPPLRLQHLWSFLKNKDLCSNSFISWSIWTKNNLGLFLEDYWERNCLTARFQLAIWLCQTHFIGEGKEKGGTTKSHNFDSSLPNSSISNTSTETSFEARRQKP